MWITAASWRLTTSSVLPGFALGQGLADADDRREAVRQRGLGLVGDRFVALGVVLARRSEWPTIT